MNSNPRFFNDPRAFRAGEERRAKPRITQPYPAIVRGLDTAGWEFEEQTVLDNLSANSLYLRLTRSLPPGAMLFIVFRLSIAPADAEAASTVAVRGVVLRAELRPDGSCGLAVAFRRSRFL